MSTRWTPDLPKGQPPQRRPPDWKKYLLPGAGIVAFLAIAIVVVAIIGSGGNGDDESESELVSDSEATEVAEEPEATPTPEEEDPEETPTPEVDDEPEITPTATPEPEESGSEDELVPEPTPVAEQEPTATPAPQPEPAVGDFGELPAGDMPSGSPAEALNLSFELNMSLQAIPSQAAAYQIGRQQWSLEGVQQLASNLGIEAEVVDQGGGSFRAEGESGSLYISPGNTQYVRQTSADSTPELPGNDQLVQTARNWLTNSGTVAGNIGSGQVQDRNEASGVAYVLVMPAEPADIISRTPSASVYVRGDGEVVEASINWPASLQSSTYGLRPAEDLWADATSGRGFVDIRASELPAGFQGSSATASISSASIAYTVAGGAQGAQYLVPVAVFNGTVSVQGSGAAVPVRIYVQAAAAQAVPRG